MSETSSPVLATDDTSGPPLVFRLQPDGRQVLTRKRARELLAPLSEAPYTSISLGGCALGDAAAGIAGPALVALANKKCVRSVALADCIASLPQDEALRSLSALASSIGIWKGLHAVDLSYNALGSRGVAACAPLLRGQRKLAELHLVESGLAAESARLIQRYLCAGPTTKLRVMHVHANRLESQGMSYLAEIVDKSPALESLRLSTLGAGSPALQHVAAALRDKSSMRELDLSDNRLDTAAAADLAIVLSGLPVLERLVLRDLDMGDDALAALLIPLADTDCPVTELALAGNELSPAAAQTLSAFVCARSRVLQILDLSRNELGGAVADAIAEALRDAHEVDGAPPALTQLLLAGNGISGLPIVRLALQLVTLPALQCFDVSGNRVSDSVSDRLATALGSHVVLYDGLDASDEVETADEEGEGQSDDDEEELQSALQELANAPCAVPKELPIAGPAPGPNPGTPSSQSQSAVSRLVSIFSRSTDEGVSESGSSRPATNVEAVEELGPIDNAEGRSSTVLARRSFEDDSGLRADRSDMRAPAPGLQEEVGGGVTATSISTREAGDMAAENSPFTPKGNLSSSNTNVIQSARKLKESIASLRKEISDVAGELQIPVSAPSAPRTGVFYSGSGADYEVTRNVNEYLLVGGLPEDSRKMSSLNVFLDVLGGLLVGMFIVVLVLAIAQSQEESSFSYRLV